MANNGKGNKIILLSDTPLLKGLVDAQGREIRKQAIANTPVADMRSVILDEEILAQACPNCHATKEMSCVNKTKKDFEPGKFHRERVFAAYTFQIDHKYAGLVCQTEKTLVTYYAFIMLCDSVSAQSEKMIGRKVTTIELQKYFAHKAMEELKKDHLIE